MPLWGEVWGRWIGVEVGDTVWLLQLNDGNAEMIRSLRDNPASETALGGSSSACPGRLCISTHADALARRVDYLIRR